MGDIQAGLIRPNNDTPSMYKDWREKGMQGVQHLCPIVDDLDHARELTEEACDKIIWELVAD